MGAITIDDYIDLFRKLDYNSKLEVLSRLPLELKSDGKRPLGNGKKNNEREADELFGIWKDEDDLTEKTIINRPVENKSISLD
ncbi:MAG: hypothetical protein AAF741_10985 [Bacteroidota bacterium]